MFFATHLLKGRQRLIAGEQLCQQEGTLIHDLVRVQSVKNLCVSATLKSAKKRNTLMSLLQGCHRGVFLQRLDECSNSHVPNTL